MRRSILNEVIEVEKEIQGRAAIEKRRSEEWIDKVRKEADEEAAGEEERLKKSLCFSEKNVCCTFIVI